MRGILIASRNGDPETSSVKHESKEKLSSVLKVLDNRGQVVVLRLLPGHATKPLSSNFELK